MATVRGFPVKVLVMATDPDGEKVTIRKSLDLWGSLTQTEKDQVQAVYDRVQQLVTTRYGADLVGLEGLEMVPTTG